MKGSLGALLAVVVLVMAAAIAIVVTLGSSDDTALVDLEPGMCFELPDEDAQLIESVVTVECAEPHLAEVVAVGELATEGAPYPDDDGALFELVERACARRAPAIPDAFGLLPIAPTEQLWESFDGRYVCVAIPFGGEPVTGSLTSG